MTRRTDRTTELPLLAWGEQLRAARETRRWRARCVVIVGAGIALIGLTMAFPPVPRLVWNATASAPIGLYAVTPGAPIDPGDMVIARLADPWRRLADERHYIPSNVPLVKRVAAGPGDEVCALGPTIFVNGQPSASRHFADARRRPMPWWTGCVRLHGHQFFLLMSNSPASFDGRYFGLTDDHQIVGKARLLWAR